MKYLAIRLDCELLIEDFDMETNDVCFTGATATGRRLWKSGEGSFGPVAHQQGMYIITSFV